MTNGEFEAGLLVAVLTGAAAWLSIGFARAERTRRDARRRMRARARARVDARARGTVRVVSEHRNGCR